MFILMAGGLYDTQHAGCKFHFEGRLHMTFTAAEWHAYCNEWFDIHIPASVYDENPASMSEAYPTANRYASE
jgi:hypothetical protein